MFRVHHITILILFILVNQNLSAQQYQLSKKDTSEVRFINSRKFWIYKVEKGETLFSISQKFKIPQEELHEFNPEISTDGLKAKMKIWVPAYSWLAKKDSLVKINLENEIDQIKQKGRLKVLVLIALDLPKQYTNQPMDDSSFVKENLPINVKENLEFLEGILISSQDYSDKDHTLELVIEDTEADSMRVKKIFSKLDLNSIDLILTNENGDRLRVINKYSLSNNIPLFSAGINTTEIIHANQFAYALSPSSLVQCKLMGISCSEYFNNSTCMLLKTGLSREDERAIYFKDGWQQNETAGLVKSVNFSNGYTKALKDSLQKSKLNIIFVPSSNEDIISSLLSSLKELIQDYRINVIGLPTWLYSQSIDPELFDTCNTFLFSAGYIDFNNPEVTEFRKKFRDHYHTEPLEVAYLAYDAFQIAVDKHFEDVKRKGKEKKRTMIKGLYSGYHFIADEEGNCKENTVIRFYKFENAIPVSFNMVNSLN